MQGENFGGGGRGARKFDRLHELFESEDSEHRVEQVIKDARGPAPGQASYERLVDAGLWDPQYTSDVT